MALMASCQMKLSAQPGDGPFRHWSEVMIQAQPPVASSRDRAATAVLDDPAFMWLMPVDGGFVMFLRHTTRVCCGEGYVDPQVASLWDFLGLPPMDFFNGMDYRLLLSGFGQAIWSYPLGGMLDAHNGPVGMWTGPPPLLILDPDPDDQYDPLYVWSGLVPNLPVPTEVWFTCAGDADGSGVVDVRDVLYELSHWDLLGVPVFLDTLAHWGETCP